MKAFKVKALGSALALLLIAMMMSGCWAGEVKSETTLTSDKGAGSQVISIEILKDHMEKPDGNGKVEDNSKYFPGGMEPVTEWLKDNVPSGFAVNMTEDDDKWVYAISFSFDSIQDYNSKLKQLIGDTRWTADGLKEATLTTAEADGGVSVTFTLESNVLKAAALQYIEPVFNNSELFDPKKGGDFEPVTLDQVFKLKSAAVMIGGSETTIDLSVEGAVVTHTGVVKQAAAPTETAAPAQDPPAPAEANPKTGDSIQIYAWLLLASAAVIAALLFSKKRSMN